MRLSYRNRLWMRIECGVGGAVTPWLHKAICTKNTGTLAAHLHHGAVAVDLQHLPAAVCAIGQAQVDDLRVFSFLRACKSSVSISASTTQACAQPQLRTFTFSSTTSGPLTAEIVR